MSGADGDPKRIVVLDGDAMRGDLLRPLFAHKWMEHPLTRPEETAERIADAHVVIANKAIVSRAAVEAAGSLELVAVAATGTDNVDMDACREAGVAVCNVRNYANQSVAEHVIALIYCISRNIVSHHCQSMAGQWSESKVFSPDFGSISDVCGRTMGIVGAGSLGHSCAALAEAVGMSVFYMQRDGVPPDSLPRLPAREFFAKADVVSLHCPLTPETRHLIRRETLAIMKPGAILINTGRGGLVDSSALADALNSGHLGGAGIDVLPKEPPPTDDPILKCRHPGLIVTPHVAWAGENSLDAFRRQLCENIEKFYDGSPQNLLCPGRNAKTL